MSSNIKNENIYDIVDRLLKKMYQVGLNKEEYKALQYLLICNVRCFLWNYPVCKTTLTGDKIIFIADTHFGAGRENTKLVDFSYDKAAQENIKTVVHLGDMTNGTPYSPGITFEAVKEQFDMSLEHMPDDITTKLLFGNHEFYTVDKFRDIVLYYFNSPKLEILGMKCVVASWNNLVNIALHHDIKGLCIEDPDNVDLKIQGHCHYFSVNEEEKRIVVPALVKRSYDLQLMEELGISLAQDALVIASIEDLSTVLFRLYDSENSVKTEATYDVKSHVLRKL